MQSYNQKYFDPKANKSRYYMADINDYSYHILWGQDDRRFIGIKLVHYEYDS